jgi:hypothetical protein
MNTKITMQSRAKRGQLMILVLAGGDSDGQWVCGAGGIL